MTHNSDSREPNLGRHTHHDPDLVEKDPEAATLRVSDAVQPSDGNSGTSAAADNGAPGSPDATSTAAPVERTRTNTGAVSNEGPEVTRMTAPPPPAPARVEAMAVVSGDVEQVVSDNTSFALELYSVLDKEEGNFVYSPYSISLVLAMAYAGAGGETERQMARSLSFTLPQDRLHPAFNALDLDLKSRGSGSQGRAFQLSIANSMWGQDGHSFLPTYLETLAVNYGGEIRPADFRQHPEEARRRINQWVSTETNGKVDGLLSHDAITPLTKLVLAQAVYFKAVWLHAFEPRATREWPFFALASTGRRVRMVELMRKTEWFGYARGDGFLAVDLPYSRSGVSMTILLPDAGRFIDFADSLNAEVIKEVLHGLMDRRIELEMPRFKLDASLDLVHILKAMGMPNAFDEKSAEFQGMDGLSRLAGDDEGLQISDVVHQAYVSVDEAGTEAAAATAVHMLVGHWSPERPVAVTIDRPFVFLIRDKRTGAILFLGQVVEL